MFHDKRKDAVPTGLILAGAAAGLFYAARTAVRFSRRMDFRGRTVLITGGSRGLGLLLARHLGREGARLALLARDEEELARAQEDLWRIPAEAMTIRCDVTNEGEVAEAVARATEHFGRIDVLINNAGVITVGPMELMTLADYEDAMKTHFWGPVYTTLAVLPQMRIRGEGRIVNISSIGGKVPVPHLAPYCASKFALTGWSETIRTELAKEGVYVTTVCPGLMRTGSPRNATFKGQHRAEYAWFSISDSLRATSMNADRAARKIIDACRYGRAEVVLTVQAKLATKLFQMFPNLSMNFDQLIARALPGPGDAGSDTSTRAVPGRESRSEWAPSNLTKLSDRAAVRNNEVG